VYRDAEARHLLELFGYFLIGHREFEILGLDAAGGVFVAITGEDDLPFVGLENVPRVGERIEFSGLGSVREDPQELEIEDSGQDGQYYEGDNPP
jgi:hypothetical protein